LQKKLKTKSNEFEIFLNKIKVRRKVYKKILKSDLNNHENRKFFFFKSKHYLKIIKKMMIVILEYNMKKKFHGSNEILQFIKCLISFDYQINLLIIKE
jgi:hypothetical protein